MVTSTPKVSAFISPGTRTGLSPDWFCAARIEAERGCPRQHPRSGRPDTRSAITAMLAVSLRLCGDSGLGGTPASGWEKGQVGNQVGVALIERERRMIERCIWEHIDLICLKPSHLVLQPMYGAMCGSWLSVKKFM